MVKDFDKLDIRQNILNVEDDLPPYYSQCMATLEGFASACDPEANSCENFNDRLRFQLSVGDVCDGVNSNIKLKMADLYELQQIDGEFKSLRVCSFV